MDPVVGYIVVSLCWLLSLAGAVWVGHLYGRARSQRDAALSGLERLQELQGMRPSTPPEPDPVPDNVDGMVEDALSGPPESRPPPKQVRRWGLATNEDEVDS